MRRLEFSNRDVAETLHDVADLMRLKGENRFRIAAIVKAAGNVQDLEIGLSDVVGTDQLEAIDGIGKGIAKEIRSLFATGEMESFGALSKEFPLGLLDILRLPNIGPKKALTLWRELGVTTLVELEMAAKASKVQKVKGFTKKSEAILLASIKQELNKLPEGEPIGVILPAVEGLINLMQQFGRNAVEMAVPTGDLRRWQESIDQAQILVASHHGSSILNLLKGLPSVSKAERNSDGQILVDLHKGIQVMITVCQPEDWGWHLVRTTGDAQFLEKLDKCGAEVDLETSQRGWVRKSGCSETLSGNFTGEEEVFRQVGLHFVVPEQRTSWGTSSQTDPCDSAGLVTAGKLTGELHAHSTYSDGIDTLSEMAEAAIGKGYSYWGATDHGLGHGFGDSLDAAALIVQAREIETLNEEFVEQGIDFRLLKGIEAEIMADGSLGLDDETLSRLDVVVASIHSSLRQDSDTITSRCLKAIQSPHVDILGHPSSRLLGRRKPSALDVPKVLKACAETSTAVEINCNPARLDLNDVYARQAADLGCQLVLNCDAHSVEGLDVLKYGIGVARRAGLTPDNVLNCRPLPAILEFFEAI